MPGRSIVEGSWVRIPTGLFGRSGRQGFFVPPPLRGAPNGITGSATTGGTPCTDTLATFIFDRFFSSWSARESYFVVYNHDQAGSTPAQPRRQSLTFPTIIFTGTLFHSERQDRATSFGSTPKAGALMPASPGWRGKAFPLLSSSDTFSHGAFCQGYFAFNEPSPWQPSSS